MAALGGRSYQAGCCWRLKAAASRPVLSSASRAPHAASMHAALGNASQLQLKQKKLRPCCQLLVLTADSSVMLQPPQVRHHQHGLALRLAQLLQDKPVLLSLSLCMLAVGDAGAPAVAG